MPNPWVDLERSRARQFSRNAGELRDELAQIDLADRASPQDTVTCGKCGEEAHFRATVGTYQCPNRHVLSYAGDWR